MMASGTGFNPFQLNPFNNITDNHAKGSTQKVALENQGFEIQLPKSRDIQEIIDCIDPIKLEFMKDPKSLDPCGHIFDEDTLFKKLQENKKKICPHPDGCNTPYTTVSSETWLKTKKIDKYISELNEPSPNLKQKLTQLVGKLPHTAEKTQIIELIDLFNKGQCEEASTQLSTLMRISMNRAYNEISSLMDAHVLTLKEKHAFTIQKALSYRNRLGNSADQNSSTLLQANGSSSSTSSNIPMPVVYLQQLFSSSSTQTSTITSSESTTQTDSNWHKSPPVSSGSKHALDNPVLPQAKFARNDPNKSNELECESEECSVEEIIIEEEDSVTEDDYDHSILDHTASNSSSTDTTHSSPLKSTTNGNENQPRAPSLFDMLNKKYVLNWGLYITPESVKSRDGQNNTPLHLAVQKRKTLNGLLKNHFKPCGADFNAQNNDGDTPLHLAVRKAANVQSVKNHIRTVINPLRQFGAKKDIINNAGQRPCDCTHDPAIKDALR